jgi:hypothetical protein
MAIGASHLSDESTGANHLSNENTGSIYINERFHNSSMRRALFPHWSKWLWNR